MDFLPIVERELRVGARTPATYWSRMAVPLVGSLILGFFIWSFRSGGGIPAQMVVKQMFYMCFGGIFAGCLFAGIKATSDSISREKREGTLGLLFLTDLRGYDIVLGKLASSSVTNIYSAMGMMPVVSVIFLFGGVDWTEVLKVLVTSGNALFFSLSAGLLASVFSVEERKARSLASVMIVASLFIGPAIGAIILLLKGQWSTGQSMNFWYPFLLTSPIAAFASSVSNALGNGFTAFLCANGVMLGAGCLFLVLACYLAPRTWQEKGTTKPTDKLRVGWRAWLNGSSEEQVLRRARMLDINAIHWLTNRDRWRGGIIWVGLMIIPACFLGFGLYLGKDFFNPAIAVFFVVLTNAVLKLSLAGDAGRWIIQDRQNGVLELILTTPMKVEEVLEGQRITLHKLYQLPFFAGGILQVIFFFICCYATDSRGTSEIILGGTWMLLASLAVMAVDYHALAWVGMWHALSVTPITKARPATVSSILVWPWGIFYFGMIALAIMTRGIGAVLGFVIWPALMLGIDVWWINRAKAKLLAEFRVRAMERYSAVPAHPWWAIAGRWFGNVTQSFTAKKR